MENIIICPISHLPFDDPVCVPCCGNSFSRLPLKNVLIINENKCPICFCKLINFDIDNYKTNKVIEILIKNYLQNEIFKFEIILNQYLIDKINLVDLIKYIKSMNNDNKEKVIYNIFSGCRNYGLSENDRLEILTSVNLNKKSLLTDVNICTDNLFRKKYL